MGFFSLKTVIRTFGPRNFFPSPKTRRQVYAHDRTSTFLHLTDDCGLCLFVIYMNTQGFIDYHLSVYERLWYKHHALTCTSHVTARSPDV